MKHFIAQQNVIRILQASAMIMMTSFGMSAGWAQGGAQTHAWSFDEDVNPTPNAAGQAVASVGQLGMGWQESMAGLPGATGFWDLGQAGQMQVQLDNLVVGPAQITVQVRQWNDGWLYELAPISVPGGVSVGSSWVDAPTAQGLGSWRTHESVWSIPAGTEAGEVLVLSAAGAVIDAMNVSLPVTVAVPLELAIAQLSNGDIEISWPVAAGGAQLQSRATAGSEEEWLSVEDEPQIVGDRYVLTLAPDEVTEFFRLQQ